MSTGAENSNEWERRIADVLVNGQISELDSDVIYTYVGPINQDKVHEIVSEIEATMLSSKISKGQVKKTFTILLEGLQNMAIHSKSIDNERTIGLEVDRVEEQIEMKIIGLSTTAAAAKVESLVSVLNAMDRAEIKTHYLDVMDNGTLSAKGGAGLGLITMVMKSEGGMKIQVLPGKGDICIISHELKV